MSARAVCLVGVLACAAGVALGPPASPAEEAPNAAQTPDLSGRWRLNKELSADPQAKPAADSTEAAETLTVTQAGLEIVVQYSNGQSRSVYPNGKTYKADDGAADVKTQWKEAKLVVEKKSRNGWKMVEIWQLAADRSRLLVDQRVEGGPKPRLSLKHVYDRVVEKN